MILRYLLGLNTTCQASLAHLQVFHGGMGQLLFNPKGISTGIPELDRLLQGPQPGDNLVFHTTDPVLYRPFVQAFARWCEQTNHRLIYLRVDGSLDDLLGNVPGEDRFDCAAVSPTDLRSALQRFIQEKGYHVAYIWDNFSALRSLAGGERVLRDLFPQVCHLRTLSGGLGA